MDLGAIVLTGAIFEAAGPSVGATIDRGVVALHAGAKEDAVYPAALILIGDEAGVIGATSAKKHVAVESVTRCAISGVVAYSGASRLTDLFAGAANAAGAQVIVAINAGAGGVSAGKDATRVHAVGEGSIGADTLVGAAGAWNRAGARCDVQFARSRGAIPPAKANVVRLTRRHVEIRNV